MQNKTIIYILVILIVIAVLIGAWVLKPPKETPQPLFDLITSAEQAAIPDNWQTYKNIDYGYRIQYPSDFQLTKQEFTHSDRQNSPFWFTIYREGISLEKHGESVFLDLSVYENKMRLHPRDWFNWAEKENSLLLKAPIEQDDSIDFAIDATVKNMPAVIFSSEEPGPLSYTIFALVILSKDDTIFKITYIEHAKDLEGKENNKEIFRAFLNSLQID